MENGIQRSSSVLSELIKLLEIDMKLTKNWTFTSITLSISFALGTGLAFPSHASWFSDVTGVDINIGQGTVDIQPPRLPSLPGRPCEALGVPCIDVGREAERILREIQAQGFSPTLEGWLLQSRNDALNGGASPIPNYIRQQLNGFYDQDILNRARYKVGDNGLLNLGRLAPLAMDGAAITLIDVIVFHHPADLDNISLWVHELMHVKQYRDWGTRDFTIRYLRDPVHDRNPVENEAREAERAFQRYSYQSHPYQNAPIYSPQYSGRVIRGSQYINYSPHVQMSPTYPR